MADYAISNVPRRVVYAPSGVGPYAFTFEILDQTDIAVYKGSTLLTLTTDYTVTINLNGTGSVTLVATAGTDNITIVGAKNIQRTSDFTTGGDLFADTLNDELDNQTIYIQQVAETAERGLKAPVTDPTDIAMTLPAKDGRKGKVLAFDSTTGNPVAGPALDSVVTVIEQADNINTVADNIASVNTVAGNTSNINTVAGVSSNVTTVAGSISNVNTVATNVANVNTVATNIANVNAVGSISSNVTTVAGISAAVTSVAADATDIGTVAANIADVSAVAAIDSDVSAVAGDATDIGTVATNIANVATVGTNIANVNSVAGNATNINTVAGISGNVTTVAGISANVTTVAGIAANVTTVAGNTTNINTVAGNTSNINQVASDTVAINAASANAASAAASATSASNSATSASASAAAASAVALGNEPVRHSVRPSLLLDFANTKTLDPRITFTRASTATFYDGKTVAKAEENLVAASQEFDSAYWLKLNATVTANSTTAPDGTTTAETVDEGTATGYHIIYRDPITSVATTSYTVSCFAKNVDRQYFSLSASTASNQSAGAVFDLSSGTVASSAAEGAGWSITSTSITSFGSGWYRCVMTFVCGNSASMTVRPSPVAGTTITSNTFGVSTHTGTNKQLYIWGFQLEQRSSVTAYTATTTSPITNYIPALQTAASGVARFEHNPVTGESLGLEIEEQRTNLLLQSEDLSTTWANTRSSDSTNVVISPSGTLTGDKLIEDTTASNSHFILSGSVSSASGTYTASVYLKAAERSFAFIGITDLATGGAERRINLSTGVVDSTNIGGAGSWTSISATSTSVGNGWYRVTVTATQGGGTSIALQIYTGDASGARVYTGDGYSGIYIWGAQLEAGAFATSYIPTVASQVTRSADFATMTGTNFSSWYRADEGTLYGEASGRRPFNIPTSLVDAVVAITDNTANNRIDIRLQSGTNSLTSFVSANGTNSAVLVNTGTYAPNVLYKAGVAYAVNDFARANNGGSVVTDNSGIVPTTVNRLQIGTTDANSQLLNGTIKKIAYYAKRLTNEELQGLTTV